MPKYVVLYAIEDTELY